MSDSNISNPNKSVKKNFIASIVGVATSLLILGLVFVLNKDTRVSLESLQNFNYMYFLLAILVFLLVVLISAFRIKLMAKFMGSKISLLKSINAVFMGLYVSNITPSAIGGQPYQIYIMTQYGIDAGISTAIVATQFVTTNVFNLIVDILFFPKIFSFSGMSYMWIPFFLGFSIFLFMMFSILFLSFNRKFLIKLMNFFFSVKLVKWFYKILHKDPEKEKEGVFEQIENFHDTTFQVWTKSKSLIVFDFILASISRFLLFLIPYIFYLSFFVSTSIPLTLSDFIVVQIVVQHSAYFIPTPGSSGGFEAVFLYLLASKINPKVLSMVILGWRFVTYYFVIIVGTIISIFMSLKKGKNK